MHNSVQSVLRLACPKCGEPLKNTHNREHRRDAVGAYIICESWVCRAGHEHLRPGDVFPPWREEE